MLFQYWRSPVRGYEQYRLKRRLKVVRKFIIHCKKKEGCFLANHLKTQKHSEPVLGEQMQVKQSKGESSKPFISSVVWMAPAASRWLSPPASALLNINTHIFNNHSCSHTHTDNTFACVETETAKSSRQFSRWYKVPLETESPELLLYSPDKAYEAWMTYNHTRWGRCLPFHIGLLQVRLWHTCCCFLAPALLYTQSRQLESHACKVPYCSTRVSAS